MAGDNYWGNIYEERGKRGTMVDGWKGKGEKVVKLKDWNDYRDLVRGRSHQRQAERRGDGGSARFAEADGIIALQLHKGPPMEVYFRNMEIKILK